VRRRIEVAAVPHEEAHVARRWWAVLVIGILAAGLTAGSASAATGGTRTTSYFGSAFVGSGGASGSDDVFGDVTVWAPAGVPAFGNAEFFVLGYECLTEDTVRARFHGLRSATARGRLALDCWLHDSPGSGDPRPQHATGIAVLNLRWTGSGPLTFRTDRTPDCTYRFADRHAEVTGRVRIVIPALHFRATATSLDAESDHLTRECAFCG
jgi:hypothetical protein